MKKKIKDFKQAQEMKMCFGCEKAFTELSSISVRITNVNKKYKGSGRSMVMNYKLKLCPICLKKSEKKILEIMIGE